MTTHPNDEDIQQYVLDRTAMVKETMVHIDNCKGCRSRAETYRQLITGIEKQPASAFEFDVAALVLAELPSPQPQKAPDRSLAWIFIVTGLSFAGILVYLFWYDLSSIFDSIAILFTYLVIITVAVLLAGLVIDMYKTYRKKMNALDIS